MKNLRFKTLSLLMAITLARCLVQAQGTVYLSNLDAPSTGSYSVASDSWLAVGFRTGSNPAGYLLNSVELTMLEATGNPSSFTVTLHNQGGIFSPAPGSSLSPLLGQGNPQLASIYTFVAPPNLMLLQNTVYYIVLSAATATADGSYQWSTSDMSPNIAGNGWSGGGVRVSSDGLPGESHWNTLPGYTQFALNATAIPEPSVITLILMGFGGVSFFSKTKRAVA